MAIFEVISNTKERMKVSTDLPWSKWRRIGDVKGVKEIYESDKGILIIIYDQRYSQMSLTCNVISFVVVQLMEAPNISAIEFQT